MAAEGTEVPIFDGTQEYLYWVGCTGALQERNVKVTKSLVRLLHPGGRQLRRPRARGRLLRRPGAPPRQRVPLPDPGAAEHRGHEGEGRAEGHRQLPALLQHDHARVPAVRRQLRDDPPHRLPRAARRAGQAAGRTSVNGLSDKTATYHDPCYVSRHNNIIDEPRAVLAATGIQNAEMGRCKRAPSAAAPAAPTCGSRRAAASASTSSARRRPFDTGADLIAVACPFCMQMFESGIGSVPGADADGRNVQVFDLAELLEMSVAISKPAASGNGNGHAASSESVSAESPEGDQAPS